MQSVAWRHVPSAYDPGPASGRADTTLTFGTHSQSDERFRRSIS